MVAGLQEIDAGFCHAVNQAVFLCNTPRPATRKGMSQWFRLTDTLKRVSHNCLNQFEGSQRHASVRLDPEPKVLDEFALEYGDALNASAGQGQSPAAAWRRTWLCRPPAPPGAKR